MLNDYLNFYSNCVSTQPHPHGLLCFFGFKKKKKKENYCVKTLIVIYPAAYLSKVHFEFLLTEVLDMLFTKLDSLWVVIFYYIYSALIFFYGYVHKYQTQQCISRKLEKSFCE